MYVCGSSFTLPALTLLPSLRLQHAEQPTGGGDLGHLGVSGVGGSVQGLDVGRPATTTPIG